VVKGGRARKKNTVRQKKGWAGPGGADGRVFARTWGVGNTGRLVLRGLWEEKEGGRESRAGARQSGEEGGASGREPHMAGFWAGGKDGVFECGAPRRQAS